MGKITFEICDELLNYANELIENALENDLAEDVVRKAEEGNWTRNTGVPLNYRGTRVSGCLDVQKAPAVTLTYDKSDARAVAEANKVLSGLVNLMEDV
jgi:hypothetical protein